MDVAAGDCITRTETRDIECSAPRVFVAAQKNLDRERGNGMVAFLPPCLFACACS